MFDPIITPIFVLCVIFWPDKPINKEVIKDKNQQIFLEKDNF